eukprot:4568469-Pleurochrysis_carterae.AAC.1
MYAKCKKGCPAAAHDGGGREGWFGGEIGKVVRRHVGSVAALCVHSVKNFGGLRQSGEGKRSNFCLKL